MSRGSRQTRRRTAREHEKRHLGEIDNRERQIMSELAQFNAEQQNEIATQLQGIYIQQAQHAIGEVLHAYKMDRVWPLGWKICPQLRQMALQRWLQAGGAHNLQKQQQREALKA